MNEYSYSVIHDQEAQFGESHMWVPLATETETLDVPGIFASFGHYTDTDLGLAGYGSSYISVPRELSE